MLESGPVLSQPVTMKAGRPAHLILFLLLVDTFSFSLYLGQNLGLSDGTVFPIHLLKLFGLSKRLVLANPSITSAVLPPSGRLHAPVGSVHLFQRSEDQISADPHLADALDG